MVCGSNGFDPDCLNVVEMSLFQAFPSIIYCFRPRMTSNMVWPMSPLFISMVTLEVFFLLAIRFAFGLDVSSNFAQQLTF